MGTIGNIPPSGPGQIPGVGPSGTSPHNEGAQMDYVLKILSEIAKFQSANPNLMGKIKNLQDAFSQEMTQNPPPLETMQNQLNQLIKDFNGAKIAVPFPSWNLTEDKGKTGDSFMHFMLSFSQYLDSESDQNQKIHNWVANIGNYINTGSFDPISLYNFVNDFFNAANSLGPNPNGFTFPQQRLPNNFFE